MVQTKNSAANTFVEWCRKKKEQLDREILVDWAEALHVVPVAVAGDVDVDVEWPLASAKSYWTHD